MAEAPTAAPAKPKRGLLSLLLIIALVAIAAVGGWFGFDYYKKKKAGASAEAGAKPEGKAAEKGKAGHGKETQHTLRVPPRLPLPIAESTLVFLAGNPSKDIPPRIVTTNAFKVNSTRPNKITIMFADQTKRKHYAVTQLYLAGEDTEGLMRLINEKQAVLFENITNLLSAKMFRDVRRLGFRKLLRGEITVLVNQILETNLVQEVIIPEFITQ
ncbi:MAG: flagellar basal body-associated FliL family protein [Verrucomicrobia bacterium]|nr:flagellar basal body-associated FliL family protein [Verrucomicrobiota bacterium]